MFFSNTTYANINLITSNKINIKIALLKETINDFSFIPKANITFKK
jgi:hypothetical protein